MTSEALLVTCAATPDGDEDGPETVDALQRRGINARWCSWDDASAHLQERFGALLYARIDLLPDPCGPVVVEAEITELSLFLSYGEGAGDRFAAAVAARA